MGRDEAESLRVWMELGASLLRLNERRFEDVEHLVRQIVDAQATLAEVPAPLRSIRTLRSRRYSA